MTWALCVFIAFSLKLSKPNATSYLSLSASLLSIEFIAGAIAGLLVSKQIYFYSRTCLFLGALSFSLIIIFCDLKETDSVLLWKRVAIFTIPCFLIVYGSASTEIFVGLRIPKFTSTLGNWSYSIYLAHFIVIIATNRAFDVLDRHTPDVFDRLFKIGHPGATDNVLFVGTCTIISIVVAGFSFKYVERPLASKLRIRS